MTRELTVLKPAIQILVVCTGNICRSPLTARLLQKRFSTLAPGEFTISSAGTHAVDGVPIQPEIQRAGERLGVDLQDFSARRLRREMTDEADLILAMDRVNRRDVVRNNPLALRRTFTLREFARIVPEAPLDTHARSADRWESLITLAPRLRRPPRGAADDDVVDPYMRPQRVYRQMCSHIASAVETIVEWEVGTATND